MPASELVDHLERYAAAVGRPLVTGARCSRSSAVPATATGSPPTGRSWLARTSWSPPGPTGRPHPGRERIEPPRRRHPGADARRSTATRASSRRAAFWSSAPPRPARRSPTSWPGQGGGSCSRSAATPGCPRQLPRHGHLLVARADRPAGPALSTTRRTTRGAHGASRRSSWPAGSRATRAATDVDLNSCRPRASSSSGGWTASTGTGSTSATTSPHHQRRPTPA